MNIHLPNGFAGGAYLLYLWTDKAPDTSPSCSGPELILPLILQSFTEYEIVEFKQATPSQVAGGEVRAWGEGRVYQRVRDHCRVGRWAGGEGALEATKRRREPTK